MWMHLKVRVELGTKRALQRGEVGPGGEKEAKFEETHQQFHRKEMRERRSMGR